MTERVRRYRVNEHGDLWSLTNGDFDDCVINTVFDLVKASDYDALQQRCEEVEKMFVLSNCADNALVSQCQTLQAQLAAAEAKYENACREGVRIASFHQKRAIEAEASRDRLRGLVEAIVLKLHTILNAASAHQDDRTERLEEIKQLAQAALKLAGQEERQ